MDELDSRLVGLLRHNARASLSDISARLGVSRATVRARMERMEAAGEIIGYTVVTKADVAEAPVRGVMMIAIEGRGTEKIIRQISGLPEVTEIHSTNGRWDVIVQISTETLSAFDTILHQIRRFDGVTASETSLLLSTRKRSGSR